MSEKNKYTITFDDGCTGWSKDKDANLLFLKVQENYANEFLRSKGWLFLRDVYQMLGKPITKESCIAGWIYEKNNKISDNLVKFDIRETNSPNYIVGFNVDENIIDRL